MHKKLVALTLFFLLIGIVLIPTSLSEPIEDPWWNKNWSFRQKIMIPFVTSDDYNRLKPIDLQITFNEACWGNDENTHSIRVIYQKGNVFKELESQLYDIEFIDADTISNCKLVFIIPVYADGQENYYVYYDNEQKSSTEYINHVDVDESYYRFEPIKGFSFESWFYVIYEDNTIIYAVSQKGHALQDSISQQLVKVKPGVKNVMPNVGEQAISFNFIYWWHKNSIWYHYSSSEKLYKKEIIEDGNLMVKFAIVSNSSNDLLQSTVYYKYYYSPNVDKSIFIDVKHKVEGDKLPVGDDIDVAYATIHSGKFRSSTIDELNFGQIHRYLHFFNENNYVVPYSVDTNPESIDWQMVIGKQEDFDLGSYPWVSVDDGETGAAHGLILDSSDVVDEGEDEPNGIELQLFQANDIKLPGLDGRFSYLYIMRNHYEEGQKLDNFLPKNYVVSFKAEFFSTKTGGYKRVEQEADLYHSYIDYQPSNDDEIKGDEEETEFYDITIFTYQTPLNLLKILSSRLLRKNAYVSVELYKDDNLLVVVGASRIAFTEDYWLDWSNLSLFRKVIFPNQEPGSYLIKIYLENIYPDKREFIGYSFINLEEDITKHIMCKTESKLLFNVYNNKGEGIENVEAFILNEDIVFLKAFSDEEGLISTGVPCFLNEGYQLKLMYKGFQLSEDKINLGIQNKILPYRKDFNFTLHDFRVEIKDEQNKTLDFDIEVSLTSENMIDPISIKPDSFSDGIYEFNNLPETEFIMSIEYDYIEIKEKVKIPETILMEINLYDYSFYLKDEWNLPPGTDLEILLASQDFEESFVIIGECDSNGKCTFNNLYPGNYLLNIFYRSFVLEEKINIPDNENLEKTIKFPYVFNLTVRVFDSQGNSFSNGKIILTRSSEKHIIEILDNGSALFSVPPGIYYSEVYQDDQIIAKRKIEVLDEKNFDLVTSSVQLGIIVYIIVLSIFSITFVLLFLKKKSYSNLLKIFVIFLALTSLILPWWTINGSSDNPYINTSTNLFINNGKLVTITKTNDLYAGEFSVLDSIFLLTINFVTFLVYLGVFLILLSLVLKYYFRRKKLAFLCLFLSFIMLFLSSILFYYSIVEFSNVTVGSLNGEGHLDVNIIGENIFEKISSNWSLGIGYLMFIGSLILSFFALFLEKKKK